MNSVSSTTSTPQPLPTAAQTTVAPPANTVAPPPPPPPTPNTAAPEPDRSALKSGSGTSKLKLNGGKPEKPVLDTKGDDRWQTEQQLKDLHLNQRDLFHNLMEKVKHSDSPLADSYKNEVIMLQEAFNKAEDAGNYKECRQIHKEMQKLAHTMMDTMSS